MAEQTNIELKLDYIQRDVADIKSQLKQDYVKHDEFTPVRNIVYGQVALILTAVIGALIALVVNK